MPSNAYTQTLAAVLADAAEIEAAHRRLSTGSRGRQYGLGALNRAVVVMCVSAWEAYLEEVMKEVLDRFKPPDPPLGVWPAWNATVRSAIGRFNNPNTQHSKDLMRDAIGLVDITTYWSWPRTAPQDATRRLEEAIQFRHQIAHGTTPRPIIHKAYTRHLPGFFRKLGQRTDKGLSIHLSTVYSITTGW